MNTRNTIFIGVVVFAITLAIVTGTRLAQEAMVVAFGIAVGIAVGVPTSMLIANMTLHGTLNLPLVNPSDTNTGFTSHQAQEQEIWPTRTSQREFTVVGGAGPPQLDESLGNGNHS